MESKLFTKKLLSNLSRHDMANYKLECSLGGKIKPQVPMQGLVIYSVLEIVMDSGKEYFPQPCLLHLLLLSQNMIHLLTF